MEIKKEEGSKMEGVYTLTLENVNTGEIRTVKKKNLIPTVGRAFIASRLAQVGTPQDIRITHSAVGSGTNAAANGDTQLQNETFRKAIASASSSNEVAYFTAFYTAAEAVGTINEIGVFMNGTGTANSGTLFSRATLSVTKSAVETLTIDYTITLI